MTSSAIDTSRERQALYIEVMLLMIAADGKVRDAEMAQLSHTVSEHPVFAGMDEDDVAEAFAAAFKALSNEGFNARIAAIDAGLSDYRAKLFAFALATSICFADGEIVRQELAVLKRFQAAFGLRDEHVAEVFEAVHDEQDLAELLERLWAEHGQIGVARAHIEVMILMAAADGEIDDTEAAHLALMIAHQDELKGLDEAAITNAVVDSLRDIRNDGIVTRLTVLSRALPSQADRVRAITNAYVILVADGVVNHGETECLERMRVAFELDDSAMRAVLTAVEG